MATYIIGAGATRGVKVEIVGYTPQQIAQGIERLGKMPASVYNTPARKSAVRVKNLSKQYAPVRTGALRSGLAVSKKERTRTKGKAVYDITMKADMTDTFAKYSASGARYYYPSSIEYGFRTRNGGRVPGRYYLRRAGDAFAPVHEAYILSETGKKLDALWAKKTGGV